MKTTSSSKLPGFSAIRAKLISPAIVLGICTMLNACAPKEEPTPVQKSDSNRSAGRVDYATNTTANFTGGLLITNNGNNNFTITVGTINGFTGFIDGLLYCGAGGSCSPYVVYRRILGRYPENGQVVTDMANYIQANGFDATLAYLAFAEESRLNIQSLYIGLFNRVPEATEVSERQSFLATNSLVGVVDWFANSTEAQNLGLNITVVPVLGD